MGRPRLIILIRHGESEGNCDKSINRSIPNHKINLTARGHLQAKESGKRLRELLKGDDKVLFYTSPYARTRQTMQNVKAEIEDIKGIHIDVHEEPRMREQDFGNFQPGSEEMERIWIERAKYGHFFYRIPNGESAADVYDRVAGFNESLFRQFNSPNFPTVLVLVTHGIWARVFLMKWYRWSVEQFESLRNINHCELLIMEREVKEEHVGCADEAEEDIPDSHYHYVLKNTLRTWKDMDGAAEVEAKIEESLQENGASGVDTKDRELLERYKKANQ